MSRSWMLGESGSQNRIVIVLQGDQAFWFQWKKSKLHGSFVEPLDFDPLNKRIQCPWLRLADELTELRLDLVLDTQLDELDRVSLKLPANGIAKRWQSFKLQRSLRRDFPCATVHKLPSYSSAGDVSVLHHVIPESWAPWLRQLQEHNVRLARVVTATELLAKCLPAQKAPILLLSGVGHDERHLLIESSTPVFMRMASVGRRWASAPNSLCDGPESIVDDDQLNERAGETGATGNEVETEKQVDDFSAEARAENNGKKYAESVSSDGHDKMRPHAAELLPVKGELGDPMIDRQVQEMTADTGQRHEGIDPHRQEAELKKSLEYINTDVHLSGACLNVLRALPDWSSPSREYSDARTLATLCAGLKMSFSVSCSENKLAGPHVVRSRSVSKRVWRVGQGLSVARTLLQPSVEKARFFRRLVFLQRATLACALVAGITVVLASAHGVSNARQSAALFKEEAQIKQQIVGLRELVHGLHQSPESVTESLQLIQDHRGIKAASADDVMSLVAQAFTAFPALELSSLTWSIISEGVILDASFVSTDRVQSREHVWDENAVPNQVQIELVGTVISGDRLRDQQKNLMAFVEHLKSIPQIAGVQVLESPVRSALSSHHAMRDGPGYRLSLKLRAS